MQNEHRSPNPETRDKLSHSRFELVWDVLVFQLKLIVDSIRDIVLVPISLVAALVGLVIGGREPDLYFRKIVAFGRKTEHWINLFGHREIAGTSDELLSPLQERVLEEASRRPWLQKAAKSIDRTITVVGDAVLPPKIKDQKPSKSDSQQPK